MAQRLGETYHAAVSEMRTIGLSHSAGEKLARFLLEWAANYPEEKGQIRIELLVTHRRNCPDDWLIQRNRDAFACRLPQETVVRFWVPLWSSRTKPPWRASSTARRFFRRSRIQRPVISRQFQIANSIHFRCALMPAQPYRSLPITGGISVSPEISCDFRLVLDSSSIPNLGIAIFHAIG